MVTREVFYPVDCIHPRGWKNGPSLYLATEVHINPSNINDHHAMLPCAESLPPRWCFWQRRSVDDLAVPGMFETCEVKQHDILPVVAKNFLPFFQKWWVNDGLPLLRRVFFFFSSPCFHPRSGSLGLISSLLGVQLGNCVFSFNKWQRGGFGGTKLDAHVDGKLQGFPPGVRRKIHGTQKCRLVGRGYTPVIKHSNGKSRFSIGNTSSKAPFSIAMLDYRSVCDRSQEG